MTTYISPTDEQIAQLAIDYRAGKLYTDRHAVSADMLPHEIFLLLGFMTEEQQQEVGKILIPCGKGCEEDHDHPTGMVYEYIDKRAPMGVNGQPMFLSMQMLGPEDFDRFYQTVVKLEEAEETAIEGS